MERNWFVKLPPARHRWKLTPKAAIRLQSRLAGEIRKTSLPKRIRSVAGADMALSPDGTRCLAGVVVYDCARREVVEQVTAWRDVSMPYVPGLLSFREIPALFAAIRKLEIEPDIFLFDGQGIAHPRRFGLASHAGLLMDRPSVGCAKSRLCGQHEEPDLSRGSYTNLVHEDEVVGAVLRTRDGVKPIYVSVGHRATLSSAIRVVLECGAGYRLPEPTRLADQLVTRLRSEG